MRFQSRSAGMTLLELLVAMAIFVIIAGAGYAGLSQATAFEEQLKEKRLFWQRIETVYTLVQIDLDQARKYVPRIPGKMATAFTGTEDGTGYDEGLLVHFIRGVNNEYRTGPVSPFQGVSYRLNEGVLYRVVGSHNNVRNQMNLIETPLLDNLMDVRLRYLSVRQSVSL